LQKPPGLRNPEQTALSLGDINNHHQPPTAMFFEVVIGAECDSESTIFRGGVPAR
jgi:hypothetical protein